MSEQEPNIRLERALETIDLDKRSTMRKLVIAASFSAPVVSSFTIDGLLVTPAQAVQPTNSAISP